MKFPTLDRYADAVQLPKISFADPILQNAQVETNQNGLPVSYGGGLAVTFKFNNKNNSYAVRCFQKAATDIENRYQLISQYLAKHPSNYFIDFAYHSQGIKVDGRPWPIVRMEWVDSPTMGSYLDASHNNVFGLSSLRNQIVKLATFLEEREIAHGDLQVLNIMVGNQLKLIDYDGMFVPGMQKGNGSENGQRHFQHPARTGKHHGPHIDRFSLIVIDLSLRLLEADTTLFKQYSNGGDNIIFTANDYRDPSNSKIFSALKKTKFSTDIENFMNICAGPIAQIPTLKDFYGKRVTVPVVPQSIRTIPTGYIGAYDVLDPLDYETALKHVGERVEFVGKVHSVKEAITKKNTKNPERNQKPYVFVNFNSFLKLSVKANIWSDSRHKVETIPKESDWISLTGLVEPPYSGQDRFKRSYTNIAVEVKEAGQLRIISEKEAKYRLASVGKKFAPPPEPPVDDSTPPNPPKLPKGKPDGLCTQPPKPPRTPITINGTIHYPTRDDAYLALMGHPNYPNGSVRSVTLKTGEEPYWIIVVRAPSEPDPPPKPSVFWIAGVTHYRIKSEAILAKTRDPRFPDCDIKMVSNDPNDPYWIIVKKAPVRPSPPPPASETLEPWYVPQSPDPPTNWRRIFGWCALAAIFMALIWLAQKPKFQPITQPASVRVSALQGTATVIDGDTLKLLGDTIRLHGIDAPERGQECINPAGNDYECGKQATAALTEIIGGNVVSCQKTDTDRYGRIVATCSAGGTSLNAEMVRQGWAVAYRRYSSDYVDLEEQAKQAKAGIWNGYFKLPEDVRLGR